MSGKDRQIVIVPEGAALLDRGILEDLVLSPRDDEPSPGDIHRARVDRLVPKLNAAFVTLAAGHNGYLRDARNLREGAAVIVQVTAYAEASKACPVDRRFVIKGARVILTPGVPGVNVSRRIRDEAERARLSGAAGGADPQRDPGIVLRSAAEGADAAALAAELDGLTRDLGRIEAAAGDAPELLFRGDAAGFALREWVDPAPQEVFVARAVRDTRRSAPWEEGAVTRLTVPREDDLFTRFGIWEQVEKLRSPRIDLPSGGWMAIEPTSAMVTVDINTGGEFGGGATLTANIEAARELPRQLRLRGLGGQVTIDFAPLPKKDRRRIEDALKSAFRRDPVETTLAGWTPLGNFELQRKRERRPLGECLG